MTSSTQKQRAAEAATGKFILRFEERMSAFRDQLSKIWGQADHESIRNVRRVLSLIDEVPFDPSKLDIAKWAKDAATLAWVHTQELASEDERAHVMAHPALADHWPLLTTVPVPRSTKGSQSRFLATTMANSVCDVWPKTSLAKVGMDAVAAALIATTKPKLQAMGEALRTKKQMPFPSADPLLKQWTWDQSAPEVVLSVLQLVRKKRTPPALVAVVHESVAFLHSKGLEHSPLTETISFKSRELEKELGTLVARVDLDLILRGLAQMGSPMAHRLLHWEVTTGRDRFLRKERDPGRIIVDGGYEELCRLLGYRPNKATLLKEILAAQQAVTVQLTQKDCIGTFVQVNYHATQGKYRSKLSIRLNDALLPGYVQSLRSPEIARRIERRLVPLLPNPIPLAGRPREYGQQMTLALHLTGYFRRNAVELYQNGSVHISDDDWLRLGDQAGLPRRMRHVVRETWLGRQPSKQAAEPLLKEPESNRFTLGDIHWAERDFIAEGGRRELMGSEAGKRSAHLRAGDPWTRKKR